MERMSRRQAEQFCYLMVNPLTDAFHRGYLGFSMPQLMPDEADDDAEKIAARCSLVGFLQELVEALED